MAKDKSEAEVDALLGGAMAATEKELFAGAFGIEDAVLDETGDTSLEQKGDGLEGEVEDEGDELETPEGAEGEELTVGEEGEGEEGQARDKDGKFVAKDDAKDDADKGKQEAAKSELEKAQATKEANEGRVPPGRLREQTEKARAAEAERDALKAEREAERAEFKALKSQFDGVLAVIQRQQQPKAQEQVEDKGPPDMFEDPKGYTEYIRAEAKREAVSFQEALEKQRIETSMMIAAGVHKEAFTKAYDAVGKLDRSNPDDRATVARIWNSPNAGEALVKWHRNQETLREVGEDPAAYKERIAKDTREALMKDPEFRKQLLEGLREEAETGADGKPRTIARLPKSLNGAAGGRGERAVDASDQSDSAIFNRVWEGA